MSEIQPPEPLSKDDTLEIDQRRKLVRYLDLVLTATNVKEVMGWETRVIPLKAKPTSLFTEKELRDLVLLVSTLGLGNLGGRVVFLRSSLPAGTDGCMLVPLNRMREVVPEYKDWFQSKIVSNHKSVLIRSVLVCTPAWYEKHYAQPLASMEPIIRELLDDGKLVAAPEKGPFERPMQTWRELLWEGSQQTLYTIILALIWSRAMYFIASWLPCLTL